MRQIATKHKISFDHVAVLQLRGYIPLSQQLYPVEAGFFGQLYRMAVGFDYSPWILNCLHIVRVTLDIPSKFYTRTVVGISYRGSWKVTIFARISLDTGWCQNPASHFFHYRHLIMLAAT